MPTDNIASGTIHRNLKEAPNPLWQGYVPTEEWRDGKAYVQKPHGYKGCQSRVEYVGPYHMRCNKCGAEVKLWEWGVDYDVG
jgi:hypothetical protein